MKRLWRCPKCGRRFVSRNLYHSCGRWRLASHFVGKEPAARAVFRALAAALRRIGRVKVLGEKTRIGFQARVIFAAVTVQRAGLRGHLWVMRPRRHRSVLRTECVSRRTWLAHFRLTDPKEIDAGFRRLLKEAYRVGRQEHLQE